MDNLPDAYTKILAAYSDVSNFSGSTSNSEFQKLVSNSCDTCAHAIELVNKLALFSANESLEDLSTVEIRNSSDVTASFEQMASQREEKIKRYKAKKMLEERLDELSTYVDQPHVDDEIKRDYHLKLVQKWICTAQEELQSLRMETDLIARRPSSSDEKDLPAKPEKPFRPFILTRNAAQAAVFGAGYPSLPTMTLDEFYEQQVKTGFLPPPRENTVSSGPPTVRRIDPSRDLQEADERKKAEQDILEDADDPGALEKARRFDEFKDEHRRGSGNRMNQA